MISYIYMKVLESAPKRYDLGISILSFGSIDKIKRKIADEFIDSDDKVVEIGCGTGTLACMMANKGALIEAIDISKDMLDIAREKIKSKNSGKNINLTEIGVVEMDSFQKGKFDKVVSTLVLSELSQDEQRYTLKESKRVLKKNGLLIIGDETLPNSILKRILYYLIRLPLLILTFIITQTTTKPVKGLKEKILEAGFEIILSEKNMLESFELIIAKKV